MASKQSKLTKTERAILQKLHKSTAIYEKYMKALKKLEAAQAEFEKAKDALREIPPQHIQAMVDADGAAAEVFANEGIHP